MKHPEWEVRFNAVRELRFQPDVRALDALLTMFQHEQHASVRHMVMLALSAFHEASIEVPMFAKLNMLNPETRRELAIKRLKELKVEVTQRENYVLLMIPHELRAYSLLEIGVLMAQLTEAPFPDDYSPLDDHVPSSVLPHRSHSSMGFVDSYPGGMKFRVYRKS
jgi:hypothetical protein